MGEGEESTIHKKTKKLFGKLRRHKKNKTSSSLSPGSTTIATPPSVVNVNSPTRNISAMSTSAAAGEQQQRHHRHLFESKNNSTVVSFEDSSKLSTSMSSSNNKPKLKSSWLSRTKWFTKMSDNAFDVVDADDSGEVDEKELYSGLLLIHLKLGCYAGPAACRPVDRQRVHAVFHKMDADKSGTLDKEEFREVMMVLCSNIFTRVMVQWSMTLVIVPLVAQYILDAIYFVNGHFWSFVQDLDEYSPVMDKIELFIEHVRDEALKKVPRIIVATCQKFAAILDKVPDSVWNTVPLTLLSCILGCLAVPYIIFKVDDYFQEVAEKKKETVEQ